MVRNYTCNLSKLNLIKRSTCVLLKVLEPNPGIFIVTYLDVGILAFIRDYLV